MFVLASKVQGHLYFVPQLTMCLAARAVIDDCKKLLVADSSTILGAWGLIDADPVAGDPTQEGLDVVLLLTPQSYYIAR